MKSLDKACAAFSRQSGSVLGRYFKLTTNTASCNTNYRGPLASRSFSMGASERPLFWAKEGRLCGSRIVNPPNTRQIAPGSKPPSFPACKRFSSSSGSGGGSLGHAHGMGQSIKQQVVDGETVQEMSDTFQSIIKVFCVAASPNW
jgi:hypothetical protein